MVHFVGHLPHLSFAKISNRDFYLATTARSAGISPGPRSKAEAAGVAGLSHVLGRLDRFLGRSVQVAAERFGAPPAADPFRGLYISDADAAQVVRRGFDPLGEDLSNDLPIVDLATSGPHWQRLAEAFGLSPAEIDVVALALAPELDLRYERIFGYLQDDVTRRRPSADLALQLLCRSFSERIEARRLFTPHGRLVRYGILRFVADPTHAEPPTIGQPLRLEDDVVEFLLGWPDFDSRVKEACSWDNGTAESLSPGSQGIALRLVRCCAGLTTGDLTPHLLLAGPNEREKLNVLREAARRLGRRLLLIDLDRLARSDIPWAQAILLTARTARLRDALPVWIRGQATDGQAPDQESRMDDWVRALAAMDIPTGILATAEMRPGWMTAAERSFIRLDFPLPNPRVRSTIWAQQLGAFGIAPDPRQTDLLAETFRLDAEGVDRAAARALALARWRDPDQPRPNRADLFAGARAEAARVLPRYATRLGPAYGWDDIVLPPDQFRQLQELCERVHHRGTVLNEWGFSTRLPLGTGVAALFAGPSGAGKTMAAQVIAAALGGLDLYRVEIPAVVSKYIGETEKALEQVFREAQGTSAILFFDEADALFGRRTEVKDAHDRYANIEVSYLLQALEAYDGLTILATNLQHNLDDAFVRRLAFIVNFPYPEEAERQAIWQRCWPAATPLAGDLDVAFLARQFKLTGGDIRNAALSAAFAAAADGGRVTMAHIIQGVRREYQKLGRACADSDFGPYVGAMEEGRR
jgi:hypothetical protein